MIINKTKPNKQDRTLKLIKSFFSGFINPLSIMLICAAALSFLVKEHSEGVFIIAIVLVNAVMDFIQECRSQKAEEKLSTFNNPNSAVMITSKDTGENTPKESTSQTPFQKSISKFSIVIMKIVGITLVSMLLIKSTSIGSASGFAEAIIFATALAMAVIPETLPVIMGVTLSSGALRLSKKGITLKKTSTIEMLGGTEVICMDKTSTLTEDSFRVTKITSNDREFFETLIYAIYRGDKYFKPALDEYISETSIKKSEKLKLIKIIPNSPETLEQGMLGVVLKDEESGNQFLVITGEPKALTEISKGSEQLAHNVSFQNKKGLHRIALAFRKLEQGEYNQHNGEVDINSPQRNLVFLGVMNVSNPIRRGAKEAIKRARTLGIDIKILTGDSLDITKQVAIKTGIMKENDIIYKGDDIDNMTDDELLCILNKHNVFVRVAPAQKQRIVSILKRSKKTLMFGDDYNDLPVLKTADVCISSRKSEEIMKSNSDVVLSESSLDKILEGIAYGRGIYVNINKYIKHAMIGNIGNFLSLMLFYLLFGAEIPMLATQLLVGNIIQDLPLMTVFSDSVDEDEINRPTPRNVKPVVKTSLVLGAFTAIFYLTFFLYLGEDSTPLTRATLFLFYNLTQLLIIVSVRTKRFFIKGPKPSRLLMSSIALFIGISIALVYVPFAAGIMGFAPLPLFDLMVLIGFTCLYIITLDIAKLLFERFKEKSANKKAKGIHQKKGATSISIRREKI